MRTYPTPQEVQKAVAGKSKAQKVRFREGTVKNTEYIYVDEHGNDWHKVTRRDGIDDATGEPCKQFFQSKVQEEQWVKGAPSITLPYRLLEVLLAITLFIVEGEKTADCLNQVLQATGKDTAVATTSPMGALNGHLWKGFVQRYPDIANKKIRILPDNDKPGAKYAQTVVTAILGANPQADVKIVTLPDLPDGGDFVDWYVNIKAESDDKDNEEVERLVIKRLLELCKQAESVTLDTIKTWQQSKTAVVKPIQENAPSDIILDTDEPLASAYTFLKKVYTFNGIPTLVFYAGDYWLWAGNSYRQIERGEVEKKLLLFLEQSKIGIWQQNDESEKIYEPFPVKLSTFNPIAKLLEKRIFQSAKGAVPCWIGGGLYEMPSSVSDPSLLIFGKSKILNLDNMETLLPSPCWFNIAALDYDYDPDAECPQWKAFLYDILEDDIESKQTLMEWMGLCLTPITKFQKALFLIGPRRSGKGTIVRILEQIVGPHNAISPRTLTFGQNFGLESFIGKTVATVKDARFGGNTSPITELILNITGEDAVTIDRKFRPALTIQLRTKLTFLSNEVPSILDQSGALPSRFIYLKLTKSFLGTEDLELTDKLSSELPGICRLAIRHLKNLLKRGYFIQPESGKGLSLRMASLSSPVSEFMRELRPSMTTEQIWEHWKGFCVREGRLSLGTKNALFNNLESAGYNSDLDAADILAKIRKLDGEASVRQLQQGIRKFRDEDDADRLRQKLREMVNAGLVESESKPAKNGRMVEYFCIPE